MYFCDTHTHSRLSPDSDAPLEAMAQQAAALGLQVLYVTDHCDLVNGRGHPVDRFDWPAALAQLRRARAQVPERELFFRQPIHQTPLYSIALQRNSSILSKGITSILSYRSVWTASGMIISSLLSL